MLCVIQTTILFVCRLLLQNKEPKLQLEEMHTGFVKVVRTLHTINVIRKIDVSHNLRQTTRCSWLVISRHTSITTNSCRQSGRYVRRSFVLHSVCRLQMERLREEIQQLRDKNSYLSQQVSLCTNHRCRWVET